MNVSRDAGRCHSCLALALGVGVVTLATPLRCLGTPRLYKCEIRLLSSNLCIGNVVES